jgi:hypothetical protein
MKMVGKEKKLYKNINPNLENGRFVPTIKENGPHLTVVKYHISCTCTDV